MYSYPFLNIIQILQKGNTFFRTIFNKYSKINCYTLLINILYILKNLPVFTLILVITPVFQAKQLAIKSFTGTD